MVRSPPRVLSATVSFATVASVRNPAPAGSPVPANTKAVLPSPLSVVVLPFANLSSNPERTFADQAVIAIEMPETG